MKKSTLFILLASLILSSCASTAHFISENANLSDYDFVVLELNSSEIEPSLCGFDVKIFDTLNSQGFKSLGEKEISSLSEDELKKTLLVNTNYSLVENEVVLSLNFVDAFTGRPVANCYSSGDIGLGYSRGIIKATEKIQNQIKNLSLEKSKLQNQNVEDFSQEIETNTNENTENQNEIELKAEDLENTNGNEEVSNFAEDAELSETNSATIKNNISR